MRIAASLRRRRAHPEQAWSSLQYVPAATNDLCAVCYGWLRELVSSVRNSGSPGERLVGAPAAGGRSLVFGDQCQLCREVVQGFGIIVECEGDLPRAGAWQPMFVCIACDGWLSSVANDGRSLRGEATRVLDGPYGEWLHPNLVGLTIEAQVRDEATLAVVRASCQAMGIGVTVGPALASAPVLLVDAHHSGRATRILHEDAAPRSARIVLTSLAAHDDLRHSLDEGATDWLTIPLTPQQLTAALVRARRRMLQQRVWDTSFCLPQAFLEGNERPTLRFEPAEGCDLFELAWALRRFSRGYDELATDGAAIFLVLRAGVEDLDGIIRRLRQFTGNRARITCVGDRPPGQRTRFEVAG